MHVSQQIRRSSRRLSEPLKLVIMLALACSASGCESFVPCEETPGCRIVYDVDPGADGFIQGVGVGEACGGTECRSGLDCVAGTCAPGMSLQEGERCVMGAECDADLQCALGPCPIQGVDVCPVCVEAGNNEEGEGCQSDLDCTTGLRCVLVGFSAQCARAGDADLGQGCEVQPDCFQGLFCNDGECSLEPPLFQGITCPEPNDEDVMAYFSVPGAEGTPDDADYFQFPFPNDFRLREDGRPELGDFPTPGPGLMDVDIVARYVEAIERRGSGWSTNPTVIFRFSGAIDLDSFQFDSTGFRGVNIIDVDALPSEPAQGVRHHSTHYSVAGRSNYVCDNWFGIRTPRNTLIPGHRYVVFLLNGTSAHGEPILRSPQFEAMLGQSAPKDEVLARAWRAHAPLREMIAFYQGSEFELDPGQISVATVITTGDTPDEMRKLAGAVRDSETPTASKWVRCDAENSSPCPSAIGGEGRACEAAADGYDEYQALLEVPIFQQGEAPYLEEGGLVTSEVQRTEKICVSLSVPTLDPPASGWPIVIYGHGTGGSYRSHLTPTVARRLAEQGIASFGYDQVQHGPRRGEGEGSDMDPEQLFFNFVNPDAARGNPLQGAADVLSVLRFLSQGGLAMAGETGDVAISVDPSRIAIYGHSQGATHASMALPFSTLPGGVLSGNGGGLVEALLGKKKPVDIAGAIPFVIQDVDSSGQLRMGDKHPVLSLLQTYIDPADPVNFAALLAARPEPEQTRRSVLQTFGLDDSYAPPATLGRFVYAAELMDLAAPPAPLQLTGANRLALEAASGPVSGNVPASDDEADPHTLVCRQYAPETDGHFVADEVPQANADVIAFLSALTSGTVPVVPAP